MRRVHTVVVLPRSATTSCGRIRLRMLCSLEPSQRGAQQAQCLALCHEVSEVAPCKRACVCLVSFPHRAGRGLKHADTASVQCGVYALHEVQLYAIRREREAEIGVWCGCALGKSVRL